MKKEKLNGTIRYLRDSFFAARRFTGVADLNAQLSTWVSEVAMVRQWPGAKDKRRVVDVFGEEKPRLMPLPAGAFSTDVMRAVASGKTPYVRFDGNDYSLPHTLVKKPLTLCASENEVRLLDGLVEVARHPRSYDKGRRFESEGHLAGLAKEKRHAAQARSPRCAEGFAEARRRILRRALPARQEPQPRGGPADEAGVEVRRR